MRKLDTKYLGRNIVVALGLEMVHSHRTECGGRESGRAANGDCNTLYFSTWVNVGFICKVFYLFILGNMDAKWRALLGIHNICLKASRSIDAW
jgi:hypothetical protein